MLTKFQHVVLFSGGLSSFEVSKRIIQKYGKTDVRLWFFDTLIEDNSLYRFVDQCQEYLGIEIERFCDGRNPWQVFQDERYIGNSRVPLCNRVLKREVLLRQLRKDFPKKNVTLYLGYEFFEEKRMKKSKEKWENCGYLTDFPLANNLNFDKVWLMDTLIEDGIKIPELYKQGFKHNNCGGACVQAGIGQWTMLFNKYPERYIWHEEQEQITREILNKDVSILRDRTGNMTKPLTLRNLRKKIETSNRGWH